MKEVIFRHSQGLGDAVMFTGALRDLHRAYPNRFITHVAMHRPLWPLLDNNPYVSGLHDDALLDPSDGHYIEVDPIEWSNSLPHAQHLLCQKMAAVLRVPQFPCYLGGAIYKTLPLAPVYLHQPYWVMLTGAKLDTTTKLWPDVFWEELAQLFQHRPYDDLIELGGLSPSVISHNEHYSCIDYRGGTSLVGMLSIIGASEGVICGITGGMHVAAALNKRCIVIAGGRESSQFFGYPSHKILHTIGQLQCCERGACWKHHTVDVENESDRKCLQISDMSYAGRPVAKCMTMITPDDVMREVLKFARY